MKPTAYLDKYSNEDVANLITSGSITSKFDSSGNLLIDYYSTASVDSSITVLIESIVFNPLKVESRYDVKIREFTVQ